MGIISGGNWVARFKHGEKETRHYEDQPVVIWQESDGRVEGLIVDSSRRASGRLRSAESYDNFHTYDEQDDIPHTIEIAPTGWWLVEKEESGVWWTRILAFGFDKTGWGQWAVVVAGADGYTETERPSETKLFFFDPQREGGNWVKGEWPTEVDEGSTGGPSADRAP